jgi:hypothetical protein
MNTINEMTLKPLVLKSLSNDFKHNKGLCKIDFKHNKGRLFPRAELEGMNYLLSNNNITSYMSSLNESMLTRMNVLGDEVLYDHLEI